MHRIFVYGTLKSGQPNNHYLSNQDYGKCWRVGAAVTKLAFPLVIGTVWNLPLLLHAPGKGQKVFGEIYEVDDACLSWLDEFEGHPDMYERDRVEVQLVNSSSNNVITGSRERDTVECWVYFLKKYEPELLESETYSCYNSEGDHKRNYVAREDRSSPSNFQDAMNEELDRIKTK